MQIGTSSSNITIGQVQAGFAILGFLAVWGASVWRILKSQAKKESDAKEARESLTRDINAVGSKVNSVERSCTTHDADIANLKIEQGVSGTDRTTMREKIAANAASITSIKEEIQTDRLAVMTQLHNNEKAAAERDAALRERLASITERLDIERMIASVVRNMSAKQ